MKTIEVKSKEFVFTEAEAKVIKEVLKLAGEKFLKEKNAENLEDDVEEIYQFLDEGLGDG